MIGWSNLTGCFKGAVNPSPSIPNRSRQGSREPDRSRFFPSSLLNPFPLTSVVWLCCLCPRPFPVSDPPETLPLVRFAFLREEDIGLEVEMEFLWWRTRGILRRSQPSWLLSWARAVPGRPPPPCSLPGLDSSFICECISPSFPCC